MEIEDIIQARPAGRPRQASWYRELIEAADELGLSAAELAEHAGCSLGTIYNWKRRLTGGSAQTRTATTTAADTTRLVQVQVAPSSALSSASCTFELRLARGRSVIVPNQFDQAALVSLVEVLEQC